MKVILYLATSVNGHTTVGSDGTDWVTRETIEDFSKLNIQTGVVVMGKRTYESFGDDFPQPNCLNIVMTKDKSLLSKTIEGALFTDENPRAIVNLVEEKGYKEIFLIGGATANTSFLAAGLINEVWINIHPILIGNGKYLFNEVENIDILNLDLIEFSKFNGNQILLKYSM
jgi:dihydrofolate reductase